MAQSKFPFPHLSLMIKLVEAGGPTRVPLELRRYVPRLVKLGYVQVDPSGHLDRAPVSLTTDGYLEMERLQDSLLGRI